MQKALDVEANNISNVNTVGFKSDSVSFQDMMYNKMQIGMGSNMPDVEKNFKQGQISYSGFNYDFAIDGEGFFTVINPENKGYEYFTRAGNFQMGEDSYLQNATNMRVLGLVPVITGHAITSEYNQRVATATFEDNDVAISINTFSTDYSDTATATGTSGNHNKTKEENLADIQILSEAYEYALFNYGRKLEPGEEASRHIETVTYGIEATSDEKFTMEILIDGTKFQQSFDTDVATTLKLFSDKINNQAGIISSVDTTTGELTIESLIAGKELDIMQAKLNDALLETTVVTPGRGSGLNLVEAIFEVVNAKIESQGGKIASIKSEITKTLNENKPDLQEILLDLKAQKFSDEEFGELVNEEGNIYLTQGEAKFLVGRLEPVVFNNIEAMKPEGHNLYSKTISSGDPIFRTGKGEIRNEYLEESNTNLADGLVKLMTWQKSFSAASKTVTTSDELLQTALKLKNN
jgi:flagellar hook protein FlgE